MEFRKTIRVPHDRIAILIGSNGSVKKELEHQCSVKINISFTFSVARKFDESYAIGVIDNLFGYSLWDLLMDFWLILFVH